MEKRKSPGASSGGEQVERLCGEVRQPAGLLRSKKWDAGAAPLFGCRVQAPSEVTPMPTPPLKAFTLSHWENWLSQAVTSLFLLLLKLQTIIMSLWRKTMRF